MHVCSLTDIGEKREMNQDYLYACDSAVGVLPNLYMIADGMGGHSAGEFASRNAIQVVVNSIRSSKEVDAVTVIREAVEKANYLILDYARKHPEFSGMGTTLVLTSIFEGYVLTANVGDSRMYQIGDTIHQITRDHSFIQEMVRNGEMDEKTASIHPDRHKITRAVGVSDTVEIDIFEVETVSGQQLLLCSDGLSNMVKDEEICSICRADEDITKRAQRLIRQANTNGGKDNITVILIELNS